MLSSCRGGHVDGKNLGSGYASAIVGLAVLDLGVGTFSVFLSLYCLSFLCFYYYVYIPCPFLCSSSAESSPFILFLFFYSFLPFPIQTFLILLSLSCFCFVILFLPFPIQTFGLECLLFFPYPPPPPKFNMLKYCHSLFAFPPTMASQ